MLIGLLTNRVNVFNHTKLVSLNNQQYMTQSTLINLHPNEYGQGLHYYSFAVNLDNCVGSCNILNDLSIKYMFQTNLNLHVFNMITGITESQILAK